MKARGEVWWYESEGVKPRPFVLLTRTEAMSVLNQVLAAPLTTTVRGIPTEVAVDETDGVSLPCVISLDNLQLVRPELLTTKMCELSVDRLDDVCEALRRAVGC